MMDQFLSFTKDFEPDEYYANKIFAFKGEIKIKNISGKMPESGLNEITSNIHGESLTCYGIVGEKTEDGIVVNWLNDYYFELMNDTHNIRKNYPNDFRKIGNYSGHFGKTAMLQYNLLKLGSTMSAEDTCYDEEGNIINVNGY